MNFIVKKKNKTAVSQSSISGFDSWQPNGSNVDEVVSKGENAINNEEVKDGNEEALQQRADRCSRQGGDLAEAGQYEEALSCWQKTLMICPHLYKVHEMKAQVYLLLEETLLALQAAEMTIKLAPYWIPGLLTLARCQREVGDLHLSVDSYERLLVQMTVSQEEHAVSAEEVKAELEDVLQLAKQLEDRQSLWQQKLAQARTSEDQEVFRCKYHLALRAKSSSKDT
jgi:tetratricopeptide (TPR) repeat protein